MFVFSTYIKVFEFGKLGELCIIFLGNFPTDKFAKNILHFIRAEVIS